MRNQETAKVAFTVLIKGITALHLGDYTIYVSTIILLTEREQGSLGVR